MILFPAKSLGMNDFVAYILRSTLIYCPTYLWSVSVWRRWCWQLATPHRWRTECRIRLNDRCSIPATCSQNNLQDIICRSGGSELFSSFMLLRAYRVALRLWNLSMVCRIVSMYTCFYQMLTIIIMISLMNIWEAKVSWIIGNFKSKVSYSCGTGAQAHCPTS